MSKLIIKEEKHRPGKAEQLKINLHKKIVQVNSGAYKFVDKDTKQFIIYMPSLEISAYGETIEKTKEMFQLAVKDCFSYLLSLPADDLQIYLHKHGWKRTMFKKEFSRIYVDGNGELQNFNAEENTIERYDDF